MTREEKENLIFEEVQKKYYEHFKEIEKKKYKSEKEANEDSKRFHNEIKEYISKRKKELELE